MIFSSMSCPRIFAVTMVRSVVVLFFISVFFFDYMNCDSGSHGGNSGGNPPGNPPSNHSGNQPSNQSGNQSGNPPCQGGGNGGNGGKPEVVISFDSLNNPSIAFFRSQLEPIFEEMSPCVKWHFIPCSTSKIVGDVLDCCGDVQSCQINVLHACAAHYYENDEEKLGKFFICMMTDGNQYVKGEACAKKAEMDWKLLNGCQPSKQAGTFCDNRYKQLNQLKEHHIPGVLYNMHFGANAESESLACLKTGICNQIKKQGGSCPACGNSGGGSGPTPSDGGTPSSGGTPGSSGTPVGGGHGH